MDGIYIFPYDEKLDRPNIIYIKGEEKSLLIDAGGGPKTYKYVMDMVKNKNLPYPNCVLITHYHWDHMFAVGYYNSTIIGSLFSNDKIKEMLELKPKVIEDFISDDMQPEFCLNHLHLEYDSLDALKLRTIDHIIDKHESLDLGGRIVEVYEVESPHTKGSLIAYDNNSKTIFLGDAIYGHIVKNDFIDDNEKLNELLNFIHKIDYKYVVIGHAPIMNKEEFLKYLKD